MENVWLIVGLDLESPDSGIDIVANIVAWDGKTPFDAGKGYRLEAFYLGAAKGLPYQPRRPNGKDHDQPSP